MVEQTNSGKCHRHSIFVTCVNYIVITYRTTRLRDKLHAALVRAFDIVAEREKRVGAERNARNADPDALRKLDDMKAAGLIDEKEYQARKEKLAEK